MADLVRQGAVFADIGTDHGYLPVFLLLSGKIERAILADVNEGPLSTAMATVEEYGVADRTKLILADGLCGLENEGATDIAVCGMGGDLIARIISEAEFIRRPGIRLILQPMTKQAVLRETLCSLGFEIKAERYSENAGKHYLGLCAEYTGAKRKLTTTEAHFGAVGCISQDKEAYLGYMKTRIRAYERAIRGKKSAGEDTSEFELLLTEARRLCNKEN